MSTFTSTFHSSFIVCLSLIIPFICVLLLVQNLVPLIQSPTTNFSSSHASLISQILPSPLPLIYTNLFPYSLFTVSLITHFQIFIHSCLLNSSPFSSSSLFFSSVTAPLLTLPAPFPLFHPKQPPPKSPLRFVKQHQ